MKKLNVMLAYAITGTATLTAQEKDRFQEPAQDRDRLILFDGDMLQIKGRDLDHLQDPRTRNDGSVVNADGSYMKKDTDRLRLKDGECLDNYGNRFDSEYQYISRLNLTYKGLSDAQIQERNKNRFQVILIDGEVYQISNQTQHRLQQRLQLANRLTVSPFGSDTSNAKNFNVKMVNV